MVREKTGEPTAMSIKLKKKKFSDRGGAKK